MNQLGELRAQRNQYRQQLAHIKQINKARQHANHPVDQSDRHLDSWIDPSSNGATPSIDESIYTTQYKSIHQLHQHSQHKQNILHQQIDQLQTQYDSMYELRGDQQRCTTQLQQLSSHINSIQFRYDNEIQELTRLLHSAVDQSRQQSINEINRRTGECSDVIGVELLEHSGAELMTAQLKHKQLKLLHPTLAALKKHNAQYKFKLNQLKLHVELSDTCTKQMRFLQAKQCATTSQHSNQSSSQHNTAQSESQQLIPLNNQQLTFIELTEQLRQINESINKFTEDNEYQTNQLSNVSDLLIQCIKINQSILPQNTPLSADLSNLLMSDCKSDTCMWLQSVHDQINQINNNLDRTVLINQLNGIS